MTTLGNKLYLAGIGLLVVLGLAVIAALATSRPGEEATAESVGDVQIEGAPLAPLQLPEGVQVSDSDTDPAAGMVAPTLTGTDIFGEELIIGPNGSAKVIYLLAHWCGHCQEEVPAIQELIDDGAVPEGVELYAVSTAVDSGSGNYPPAEWLENESFSPPTMRDDADSSAAAAMGTSGFPFAVYLDADHRVVARSAGNLEPTVTAEIWGLLTDGAAQ